MPPMTRRAVRSSKESSSHQAPTMAAKVIGTSGQICRQVACFQKIGRTMKSHTTSIGSMMPTLFFAPKSSAMSSTLTIARPGNPVLEMPRLNAPTQARAMAVQVASKGRSKAKGCNTMGTRWVQMSFRGSKQRRK